MLVKRNPGKQILEVHRRSCRPVVELWLNRSGAQAPYLIPYTIKHHCWRRHRTHSWRGLFWINCHAHCRDTLGNGCPDALPRSSLPRTFTT